MTEPNVSIKNLSSKLIEEAAQLVLQNEAECVNLCEIIFDENAQDCYAVICEEKIVGAFCFRNRRTVFHCLPFTKYKTALDKILCQKTQSVFYEFFADEKPFCINGEASGSLFFKNIFRYKKNPAHVKIMNEYILMQKNSAQDKKSSVHDPIQSSENSFRIFHAMASDEEKLFPLERAYQIEEVIPPNFAFSDQLLRDSFKLNLQSQKILALEIGNTPVAKAAIAACGQNCALLGGVYTLPEFRRKGFAAILIRQILGILASENKIASLYVKKKNLAAVELYKKLGFESIGEYRLVYF